MARCQKVIITFTEQNDGQIKASWLFAPALAQTTEAFNKLEPERKFLQGLAVNVVNAMAEVIKQKPIEEEKKNVTN